MDYGYICFSYSKNEFIARAIAWFTNSKWSHSFIMAPKMLNREMAMEAVEGGVSLAPFDIQYRENSSQKYEIYKFNCPQEIIDDSLSKCMNQLEMGYGFLEYPYFIWRAINKFFGRDISSQENWSKKGVICSELVTTYLTSDLMLEYFKSLNKENLFQGYGNGSVSPQDIYEIILQHPDLFELIESKE